MTLLERKIVANADVDASKQVNLGMILCLFRQIFLAGKNRRSKTERLGTSMEEPQLLVVRNHQNRPSPELKRPALELDDVCLLLENQKGSYSKRNSLMERQKKPVDITWIVLAALIICGFSLVIDELIFSSDGESLMSVSGSEKQGERSAVLNALSVRASFSGKYVYRTFAFCGCFLVITIWSLSLYIKMTFLRDDSK